MPLLRRIPKRGFNNANYRTYYAIVNVEQLNAFDDGATVTGEALVKQGVLDDLLEGVKVLGNGDLKKKLTVKAQRFSASAREKITKAGGRCEDLPLLSIHHQAPPPSPPTEKKPAGDK